MGNVRAFKTHLHQWDVKEAAWERRTFAEGRKQQNGQNAGCGPSEVYQPPDALLM